jgi:hypothetical protein
MCAKLTERVTTSIGRFTVREPVEGGSESRQCGRPSVGSQGAADPTSAPGSSRVSSSDQGTRRTKGRSAAWFEVPAVRPAAISDPRTLPNAGASSPAPHQLPERETGLVEPHTATDGEITLALDVGRVDLPVTRVASFARAGTDREDEQLPVRKVSGSKLVPDLCPNEFGVHPALCCARVPAEPEKKRRSRSGQQSAQPGLTPWAAN